MDPNAAIALSIIRKCSKHMAGYCQGPTSGPMPPLVAWVLSESIKNALLLIPESE